MTSDLEPRFICSACGQRIADVRLDFGWDKRAVRETGDLPSKSFADSTAIRAYRIHGPWGTPMDIAERSYIAAAALGFLLIAAMALLG